MMRISQNLSQKNILSPQFVQSMNILKLNVCELEEAIMDMAMDNPTLELTRPTTENSYDTNRQIDISRKLDWLESNDYQNRVYYQDDIPDISYHDIRDYGENLSEYLHAQMILNSYTDSERRVIDYIIDSLDSSGYFTEDSSAAAKFLGISEHQFLNLLTDVQNLDPAGVGARDLTECLLIQLERTSIPDKLRQHTSIIICNYLEQIARKHIHVIAQKMHIELEEVKKAVSLIQTLNPRPGNFFNDRSHFQYISPDIIVVKFENHFDVLLNEYQYPRFQINSYYETIASITDDIETQNYLRDKLNQSKTLLSSISYRSSTLSQLAHLLVEKQIEFFIQGPGHKVPMQLTDLAEELNLHISTVSRALSNKYLQCCWGIYPLNYFLTSAVSSGKSKSTDSQITQEHIIKVIRQIIDTEDKKHPLSDQKITEALKKYDITISRRTVSKYRQIAQIPDKSGRKEEG